MQKNQRKKLTAKTFTIIIASLLALLIAFAIALPAVLVTQFDAVMRDALGTAGRKSGTSGGNEITDKLDKVYNKISDKNGITADNLDEYEKDLVRKSGAEGYVLLKNENNALPLAKSKTVSMFSHSSVDLLAGGTGSGVSYVSSNLKDAFKAEGYTVNETLWNFYETGAGKSYVRGAGAISYGGDENWSINECPLSVLQSNNVLASANGTQAIFVISRTGGEGRDLGRYMGKWTKIEEDKSKHYLEPDSVELGIIDYLNNNFSNVVIIVNTNNAFELGWVAKYNNISAVLWAPGGGGETANSIVDVLSGKVNPSGRLVDTFAYDAFSSPAMQNMGDIRLTLNGKPITVGQNNGDGGYGVSYEEGIYVGYKYYETRYFDKVMDQGNAGDYNYASQVQYPFGYGSSYTNFTWSDFKFTQPDNDGNMTVTVKVTNATAANGGVKGKEVVQIYVNAPYTSYDKQNYLEKSAVSLVGYAKTGDIEPGKDETVKVTVNLKDFISYDEVGYKTYILEEGAYLVTAAKDAHSATNNVLAYNNKTTSNGMTADGDKNFVDVYKQAATDSQTYKTSSTGETVTNRFGSDGNGGLSSNLLDRKDYLSRNNWTDTFPRTLVSSSMDSSFSERGGKTLYMEVTQPIVDKIKQVGTAEAANTPLTDAKAAEKAKPYNQEGDLQLVDLRGASYEDERWEKLISQMAPSEVGSMIALAGYKTNAAKSIDKPKAIDLDGPSGLNNMVAHTPYSITYPAEVNIAASWNDGIAYSWGEAVGMDGLRKNVLCSGWYAPALNIHRTPFAGRNFEYFSEDSYISGVLATEAIKGAGSMGMYSFIKHFALNDQEDHRNGMATFANEQTIREIYLKPFQMAVENSGTVKTKYYEHSVNDKGEDVYTLKTAQTPVATAVMSSFNRIGATWAGGDYRLLTEILRNEWGFKGAVLTDYFNGGYMNVDQFLRAGGDLALTQYMNSYSVNSQVKNYYTQQAMKHTLYMVANSNAMNGYVHGISTTGDTFAYYYLILIAVGVIAAGLTAWGATAIVLRWKKEKQPATESGNATDGSSPDDKAGS